MACGYLIHVGEMAEDIDQGRQRGEDDGREHVATAELLSDPQINPPPSATSSSPDTKTASSTPAAHRKPGYHSGYYDLKELP